MARFIASDPTRPSWHVSRFPPGLRLYRGPRRRRSRPCAGPGRSGGRRGSAISTSATSRESERHALRSCGAVLIRGAVAVVDNALKGSGCPSCGTAWPDGSADRWNDTGSSPTPPTAFQAYGKTIEEAFANAALARPRSCGIGRRSNRGAGTSSMSAGPTGNSSWSSSSARSSTSSTPSGSARQGRRPEDRPEFEGSASGRPGRGDARDGQSSTAGSRP